MIATKVKIKEGGLVKGIITVLGSKVCGCERRALTGSCRHKVGGKFRPIISRSVTENMVMQSSMLGLDLVIQWIIGQMATGQGAAAFVNGINYGEIGTGLTAVTLLDVGNTTPSVRTVPSLQQDFGQSQAVLQFFFPDGTLTNQTYNEFATYVNGSAALGSGNAFNHALLGTPYVKSSGQDTTVQVVFTITQ